MLNSVRQLASATKWLTAQEMKGQKVDVKKSTVGVPKESASQKAGTAKPKEVRFKENEEEIRSDVAPDVTFASGKISYITGDLFDYQSLTCIVHWIFTQNFIQNDQIK